jgi:methylated-DNA-[protein]-cysteine S-methyltransferase
MKLAIFDSPIGKLLLTSNGDALTGLYMDKEPEGAWEADDLTPAKQQLGEYFAGKRRVFDLKLAPQGTDFQMRVWKALQEIPYGETVSYLHIATRIGQPSAVRAVGAANGKNPIGIIIPCHRVIGAAGQLVGYGGGLPRKKWLLEHESPTPSLPFERAREPSPSYRA